LEEESWEQSNIFLPIAIFPESIVNTKPRGEIEAIKSLSISQKDQRQQQQQQRPCKTMDELIDGTWVWNSILSNTSDEIHNFRNFDDIIPREEQIIDRVKNIRLGAPQSSTWQPNTCFLQVYDASYLRSIFYGKHIHFIGDSTMHEIMRLVLVLFGIKDPQYEPTEPCKHNNRVFDSESQYSVRFSFAWAGGPHPCDNSKGLGSLIAPGEGKKQFLDRYQAEADFKILNVGLHEVDGSVPVEEYAKTLPLFFDLLLESRINVTNDDVTNDQHQNLNGNHIVWISSNPKTHGYNNCRDLRNDGNGGLVWMNFFAAKIAHDYEFTVMDAHRLLKSANLASVPQGGKQQCGDGHHCAGCDVCWAKALILVQYLVCTMSKELEH
jgi:hypothetical protein